MPLARYFMYVGGVLLALLLVVNAYLPAPPPIAERADAEVPVIRIHSERKWPQPVVFDTSHPTIAPAQPVQIAKTEAAKTEAAAPAADAPAISPSVRIILVNPVGAMPKGSATGEPRTSHPVFR